MPVLKKPFSVAWITKFGCAAQRNLQVRSSLRFLRTVCSPTDFVRFGFAAGKILKDNDFAEMLRNNPPDIEERQFQTEFMRRVIRVFQRDSQMRSVFMSDAGARSRIIRASLSLFFRDTKY